MALEQNKFCQDSQRLNSPMLCGAELMSCSPGAWRCIGVIWHWGVLRTPGSQVSELVHCE